MRLSWNPSMRSLCACRGAGHGSILLFVVEAGWHMQAESGPEVLEEMDHLPRERPA